MNNNQQPSSWPDNAMTYWLSGYLEGIQAGHQLAEAEMATHWAHVAHTIHAGAGQEPNSAHETKVRARQVEARQRHQAEAMPWPDEATP